MGESKRVKIHKELLSPLLSGVRFTHTPTHTHAQTHTIRLYIFNKQGEKTHSGGIHNENLITEFRFVASELRDKFGFVVAPGNVHDKRMVMLGLKRGGTNLPAIAVNSREGRNSVFPDDSPMNRDTILQFCTQVLRSQRGNRKSSEESMERNLQAVTNRQYPVTRSTAPSSPFQYEKGVAERFDKSDEEVYSVKAVTMDNFDSIVMNEDNHVLLMIHTR